MKWFFYPTLFFLAKDSVIADDYQITEPNEGSLGQCEENIKEFKNSLVSLEFYIQDKKHHVRFCPEVDWQQPTILEYKKDPRSHLPEECITSEE